MAPIDKINCKKGEILMARLQIHTGLPDISLDVIIPEYARSAKARTAGWTSKEYYVQRNLPVLWLLHGGMGSATDWPRYTRIELYAEEKGLIVVCPSGDNGCWVNQVSGQSWEDIVTEKLWEFVHSMFPSSDGCRPSGMYISRIMGMLGCILPQEYKSSDGIE